MGYTRKFRKRTKNKNKNHKKTKINKRNIKHKNHTHKTNTKNRKIKGGSASTRPASTGAASVPAEYIPTILSLKYKVNPNILDQTLFPFKHAIIGLLREFCSERHPNEKGEWFTETGEFVRTTYKIPDIYMAYSLQFMHDTPKEESESESDYTERIMEKMAMKMITDFDEAFDIQLKNIVRTNPVLLSHLLPCVNHLKLELFRSIDKEPLSSYPDFMKTQLRGIFSRNLPEIVLIAQKAEAEAQQALEVARSLQAQENEARRIEARAQAEAHRGWTMPESSQDSPPTPREEAEALAQRPLPESLQDSPPSPGAEALAQRARGQAGHAPRTTWSGTVGRRPYGP